MPKTKVKGKKKLVYNIIAPKIFKNIVIGKTLASDPNSLIGRTLVVNLMSLTDNVKSQSINVKFRINKVEKDNAHAIIIGYEMVPPSVKRVVRRGRDRIDLSSSCITSDKIKVRVKPLLITKSKSKGSVLTTLRRTTSKLLKKYISSKKYNEFVKELINHKLQDNIKSQLNKIYPLRICEIRVMEIEKTKEVKTNAKASN